MIQGDYILVAVKTIMPCDTKRAKGYKQFLTLKYLQHEKGHDEQITRIITTKRIQMIHQVNTQFVTTNANKIITITTSLIQMMKTTITIPTVIVPTTIILLMMTKTLKITRLTLFSIITAYIVLDSTKQPGKHYHQMVRRPGTNSLIKINARSYNMV